MFSEEYANEKNELTNKTDQLNNGTEKIIKEIGKLLKDNPDLKQRLKSYHFKYSLHWCNKLFIKEVFNMHNDIKYKSTQSI